MSALVFLFIALCYLVAAYLPFHQMIFIQEYQVLLDRSVIFTKLIYQSLALTILGAVILLMIYKFLQRSKEIQHRLNQVVTICKYSVLVGIAASMLTLAVTAGSNFGFWGLVGNPAPWNQQELERIALHEAGHAIIREIEQPGSTVKAKIVDTTAISKVYYWFNQQLPNGFVLGTSNSRITTEDEIMKSIRIYLAGLAAEEIIYSDSQRYVSAEDDLEQVKKLVIKLCNHGLSPAGPVLWEALTEQEKAAVYRDVVMPQYHLVVETLKKHQDSLMKVAKQLEDKKELTGQELRELIKHTK